MPRFILSRPAATAALRLPIMFAAIVLIAGVGVLADVHPENVACAAAVADAGRRGGHFRAAALNCASLPILPLPAERIAAR